MLQDLLPADLFAFFLVFARVGSAMMLMPGFGEQYVMPRYRLLLAGAITLLITPIIAATLPALPASPLTLFFLLSGEIVIGVFLGTIGRVIMSGLHVAGTVMSFQSGLANALTFDPVSAQQAAMFALFLSLAGLLFVFVTDLHHVMLEAMVMSYGLILPGAMPPISDFSQVISRLVADAFLLGIQLASPFIAVGLVFYLIAVYALGAMWEAEQGWPWWATPILSLLMAIMLFYQWRQASGGLMERLLVVIIEGLEFVINNVSATLSFLRVAAFTLNHVALAAAVFALAAMLDSFGHWTTVVLGNLFIIVLEGAIVAIQCLRLEYYEGFSRFFSGQGLRFEPLKTENL